jgi:hypothetical protein
MLANVAGGSDALFGDVRSISALARFADLTPAACDVPQVPCVDGSGLARTFFTRAGRRASSAVSHGRCFAPWILAYRITASAPVVNKLRRYKHQTALLLG